MTPTRPPRPFDALRLGALLDAAVKDGRHSRLPVQQVCQGCREWVTAIWRVSEDGKRLCRKCCGE